MYPIGFSWLLGYICEPVIARLFSFHGIFDLEKTETI